jgi:hypothetical protein
LKKIVVSGQKKEISHVMCQSLRNYSIPALKPQNEKIKDIICSYETNDVGDSVFPCRMAYPQRLNV